MRLLLVNRETRDKASRTECTMYSARAYDVSIPLYEEGPVEDQIAKNGACFMHRARREPVLAEDGAAAGGHSREGSTEE